MLLPAGSLIDDKFEVRGIIGSGGMGVVYEAYQAGLDRYVAVKLLMILGQQDESDQLRFEREALALSRLSHANIVQFYAYGVWQGMPYIAMEKIRGTSLQHTLDNGARLSVERILRILIKTCDALHHAHGQGIVHRDLKPSNMILCPTEDGGETVKLIDFGLVKLLTPSAIQKLTQTGTTVGSVSYMSPEQCLALEVDGRSDVYSLGCILHHCLTGAPPFSAENAVAIMFQHAKQPLSDAYGWNEIPASLQKVISKCMAKEPARRYSSAEALKADLESIVAGQTPQLEGRPVEKSTWEPESPAVHKMTTEQIIKYSVAASFVAVAAVAAVAFSTMNKAALDQLEKEQRTAELRVVESELSNIVRHTRVQPVNAVTAHRLEEIVETYRANPHFDQRALTQAYIQLIFYNHGTSEWVKVRRFAEQFFELDPQGDTIKPNDYLAILSRYFTSCEVFGCGASIEDKIEDGLKRFSDGDTGPRAEIQLVLARLKIRKGDIANGLRLLNESRPYLMYDHQKKTAQELERQIAMHTHRSSATDSNRSPRKPTHPLRSARAE